MNLGTTALLGAGFGGLTMIWGHIRGIFTRFSSFFLVSIEMPDPAGALFLGYCWKNLTKVKWGERRFIVMDRFIRPKGRYGKVAFEWSGKTMTFFRGWCPLFVSGTTSSGGQYNGITKISFIRGTFNVEQMLIDAVEQHDENLHSTMKTTSRHYTVRISGNTFDKDSNDSAKPSGNKMDMVSNEDGNYEGCLPLKWQREEIGAPIKQLPFNGLAYSPHIEAFQTEIKRWKESEKWFKERGLPWRFGGGLFGPPGTGKTSFVRAIGQELDMPIFMFDLTSMDNRELVSSWKIALNASPCIVLFEDIDRIFDKDKSIRTSEKKAPLTLDCLLNCINGVEPAEGILVFITANDMSKIDPALGVPDTNGKSSRPGRLDRAVFFGELDTLVRFKVAERILAEFEHLIEQTVSEGIGETGAQFESRCTKLALEQYWGDFKVFAPKPKTQEEKLG